MVHIGAQELIDAILNMGETTLKVGEGDDDLFGIVSIELLAFLLIEQRVQPGQEAREVASGRLAGHSDNRGRRRGFRTCETGILQNPRVMRSR